MLSTRFAPQSRKAASVCLCSVVFVWLGALPAADGSPPVSPVAAPEYCFDGSGPSVSQGFVGSGGDVLNVQYPHPRVVLDAAALGLTPFDQVDALSAAHELLPPPQQFVLLFSVSAVTVGVAEPAPELVEAGVPYNVVDQASRNQAAGDEFGSTELFTVDGSTGLPDGGVSWNNFLTRNNFDEGGTSHAALPETSGETMVPAGTDEDDVVASARLPHKEDGAIANLYFSLRTDSPSLAVLAGPSGSGADILFAVHPTLQACCLPDGSCQILPPPECLSAGGLPRGCGSRCDMCPGWPRGEMGACCLAGGGCELLAGRDCMLAGGAFLGPGTTCDMCLVPPPPAQQVGACCFMDMSCEVLAGRDCMLAGGAFLGPDTTCEMCSAPPPGSEGACCFGEAGCEILPIADCMLAGGTPLGPGTTCEMCAHYVLSVYATHDELGLQQQDDLDAMVVIDVDGDRQFDGEDEVLFSLAPGSPSLASITGASPVGAAADIFVARPGQPPALFGAAADLGLGAEPDDVDSLDVFCVEAARGWLATEHGIRRVRGDLNCDGLLNGFDIDAFVLALTSVEEYLASYPDCDGGLADINNDGSVNGFDIDPFVELLTGGRAGL